MAGRTREGHRKDIGGAMERHGKDVGGAMERCRVTDGQRETGRENDVCSGKDLRIKAIRATLR